MTNSVISYVFCVVATSFSISSMSNSGLDDSNLLKKFGVCICSWYGNLSLCLPFGFVTILEVNFIFGRLPQLERMFLGCYRFWVHFILLFVLDILPTCLYRLLEIIPYLVLCLWYTNLSVQGAPPWTVFRSGFCLGIDSCLIQYLFFRNASPRRNSASWMPKNVFTA